MLKSPFKFLDSYVKEDKDIFFGRGNEVDEIYHKIFSSKTLLVYGVSGTGKSSIIQCGLANRFEDSDWLPVSIRRGSDMNASFEKALAKTAHTPIESLLEDKANGIAKAVQSVYLDHFKPIYFIFDQFEELFIFGSKAEKRDFIQTVKKIIKSNIQTKFVFVIREEYLAGITEFETELRSIMENRIRIEKMSLIHAKEVIEGSCKAGGLEVEEGFSEALLENLKSSSGEIELTYLQVYLDRIYQKAVAADQDKRAFTKALLEGIGDVADILGNFLDEQIKKLFDPESGTTVLKSFVSLKGTKRQVTEEEVSDSVKSFGKELLPEQIREIIRQFTSFRILKDKDESGKYELRHDALAVKIYEKITMLEKELLEVRQYIENAYSTYKRNGLLLSKESLKYIGLYLDKLYLNNEQNEFVDRSKNEIEKAEKKRKRLTVTILSILLVIFALFTLWALSERKKAEEQVSITQAEKQKAKALYYNLLSQKIKSEDPTKALEIAEYARTLDPNNKEINQNILDIYYNNAIYRTKFRFRETIEKAKLSPDGKTLAATSGGMIRIYNLDGEIIKEFKAHDDYISAIDYSPDGQTIVSVSNDSTVVFSSHEGKILEKIKFPENYEEVLFSPDNKSVILYAVSTGCVAKLIDGKGKLLTDYDLADFKEISSIAFSPDGKKVLIGGLPSCILFEKNGKQILKLKENKLSISFSSVAISPDGNTIMTGSAIDQAIKLWDMKGNLLKEMIWPVFLFSDLYFLKNNKNIISVSKKSGEIRLWDEEGNIIKDFCSSEPLEFVFVNDDSNEIVSVNSDCVRSWDIKSDHIRKLEYSERSLLMGGVFSPDSKKLAACIYTKGLILWDVEKYTYFVKEMDEWIAENIQFSPDGNYILHGAPDSACYLRDINLELVKKFKNLKLNIGGTEVLGLPIKGCFSNDSKTILFGDNKIAYLTDLEGKILQIYEGFMFAVSGVAISPDDNIYAACDMRDLKLFNKNGKLLKEFRILSLGSNVWDIKFTADSRKIVVEYEFGDIKVFDLEGNLIKLIKSENTAGPSKYEQSADKIIQRQNSFDNSSLGNTLSILDINGNVFERVDASIPIFSSAISKDNKLLFIGTFPNSRIIRLKESYEDYRTENKEKFLTTNDKLKYGMIDQYGILKDDCDGMYEAVKFYLDKAKNLINIEDRESLVQVIKGLVNDYFVQLSENPSEKIKQKKRDFDEFLERSGDLYKIKLFGEGLKFALLAKEMDVNQNLTDIYLVMGYILTDKLVEAEKIYIKFKDKLFEPIVTEDGSITLAEGMMIIIEDFESNGVTHPDFAKVKKLLEDKNK